MPQHQFIPLATTLLIRRETLAFAKCSAIPAWASILALWQPPSARVAPNMAVEVIVIRSAHSETSLSAFAMKRAMTSISLLIVGVLCGCARFPAPNPAHEVDFQLSVVPSVFTTNDAPVVLAFTLINTGKTSFAISPDRTVYGINMRYAVARSPADLPPDDIKFDDIRSFGLQYYFWNCPSFVILDLPPTRHTFVDLTFSGGLLGGYKTLLSHCDIGKRPGPFSGKYYMKAYYDGSHTWHIHQLPWRVRRKYFTGRAVSNTVELEVKP